MEIVKNQQRITLFMAAEVVKKVDPNNFTTEHTRAEINAQGLVCPVMYQGPDNCGSLGDIIGCLLVTRKYHFNLLENRRFLSYDEYKDAIEEYKLNVFGEMPNSVDTFIFSPFWRHCDNTPQGAAARMEIVASWQGTEEEWCKSIGSKPEEIVNEGIVRLYRKAMKLK